MTEGVEGEACDDKLRSLSIETGGVSRARGAPRWHGGLPLVHRLPVTSGGL